MKQLEATQCHKSDWKDNLEGCSRCKNSRRQHRFWPRKIHIELVNMCCNKFLVRGPKFTDFSPSVRRVVVETYISDFRYLDPFWRYSPTKFEVVQNQVHI